MKILPSNLNTHNKPDTTSVRKVLVCAVLLSMIQEGRVMKALESPSPVKKPN